MALTVSLTCLFGHWLLQMEKFAQLWFFVITFPSSLSLFASSLMTSSIDEIPRIAKCSMSYSFLYSLICFCIYTLCSKPVADTQHGERRNFIWKEPFHELC